MAFERDPNKLFPHDRLLAATVIRLVPEFVTPNAVTWFRFVLTPLVLWLLYRGDFATGVPLFVLLAFTDALDGSLARVRKQITEWGSLYDPIADKLLISSVILLVVIRYLSPTIGFLIVGLELALVIGGVVRRRMGFRVMANVIGKAKMVTQIVGITLLLIAVWTGIPALIPLSIATLSLAIVLAVASLFTYGL